MQGLEADPFNADVWLELSRAYLSNRKLDGALMAADAARNAAPHTTAPFLQMADIFEAAGNLGKMFAMLEEAYKIDPTPQLTQRLGVGYLKQDLPRRSLPYLKSLHQSDPLHLTHKHRLAAALNSAGQVAEAAQLALSLVQADPQNTSFLTLYAAAMKNISIHKDADGVAHKKGLQLILDHAAITPQTVAFPCLSILKNADEYAILRRPVTDYTLADIEMLASDDFLLAAIARLKTLHGGLEPWITEMRRAFLLNWRDDTARMAVAADVIAALAIACWFSDYAFSVRADEYAALAPLSMSDRSTLALRAAYGVLNPTDVPPDMIHTGGPYWQNLMQLCVTDTQVEQDLYNTFQPLGDISDQTSVAVQAMYEERPYPRWQHAIGFQENGLLGQTGKGSRLLIGGCGTGQEILYFAAKLVNLQITAIDLSRASLAYASRKAQDFGYAPRVTFYHGDLRDAERLGHGFDVVSSTGVLHHLKTPEEGLKALLSCLAPGGRMHLALYADYARTHYLDAAKSLAAQQKIQRDADSIRAFRQELLALPESDPASRVTRLMDFYSLNECTDLLFHVQECWYTLPQLRDVLDRHGLDLMTMKLQPVFKGAYLKANPNDRMVCDWDALTAFEQASDPATFIGMYDFWVKRKDDTTVHALDAAIVRQMI